MLLELRVENYAVIDHVIANFGPGLNLLTGETGAGKSLLIDALALLLGERASSDVIRHGADRAVVACVFESTPGAEAVLEENGLDPGGSEIIMRREIQPGGKGRIFVNNQPATVAVLRLLAPELALVHAQSDTRADFDAQQQTLLLDRFAGTSVDSIARAFEDWNKAKARLAELESGEQDRLRMLDLWTFQHREIAEASLVLGEDLSLETEKRVLANAEKIRAAAASVFDSLYDGEPSANSLLSVAARGVEELARYDETWRDSVAQIAAARAILTDIAETARDSVDRIQASPDRLAEIEDRLALLDRLKRKYAASDDPLRRLDEVIAFGQEVARKLDEIENRDSLIAELKRALAAAEAAYRQEAEKMTASRTSAARKLEKRAEQHINELAMKVRFAVRVTPEPDARHWSARGWDAVECLIATAAAEPLKPLREIASGGEMSRILLSLKVSVEEASAAKSRKLVLPRTLVFDEIDIGIGGRAAEAVGQKLKLLSGNQQVLCITHQPQIAAFADQHFVVEKSEQSGRTHTSVRLLKEKERAEEVARMISGAKLTDASLQHARQMIAASKHPAGK
jgi:DNA repair protein RecN (Recombination protein N)